MQEARRELRALTRPASATSPIIRNDMLVLSSAMTCSCSGDTACGAVQPHRGGMHRPRPGLRDRAGAPQAPRC
eukprot:815548-Rhodomonas_salina.2